jgi:hypothetical protein
MDRSHPRLRSRISVAQALFPALVLEQPFRSPALAVLSASVVGFAFPTTRDFGDHGDLGDSPHPRQRITTRSPDLFHPHPAFFELLLQTQHFIPIDPRASLARRLGGPCVTLG